MSGNHVLILDQGGLYRDLLSSYLSSQGFEVSATNNQAQAIKAASDKPVDLVVIDLCRVGKVGMRCIKKLRALNPSAKLPVLVLTDSAEREVIVLAAKLMVKKYLLKSRVSAVQLCSTMKSMIAEGVEPQQAPSAAEAPQAPTQAAASAPEPAGAQTPQAADAELLNAANLKELKPIMRRSDVYELLDGCGELKGMSPAVSEVMSMTRRKNCSIEALSKAIKKDQGMALKLLKMANSSVYDRGSPVDSINKAVMRMGINAVRQAVTNMSVIDSFGDTVDHRINAPHFWEHSIATGLIAAEATRALQRDDEAIENAFTMGLLHDTGRMVYTQILPDQMARVLDAADHLGESLERVESRLLLVNHAEAMDRILHAWKFPKELVGPIAFHHLSAGNIRRMAPKIVEPCCVVALANGLAHALLVGHSGNHTIYPVQEYLTALKLGGGFIEHIEEVIPDQATDLKLAMLAHSPGGWTDYRSEIAKSINHGNPRPVFVGTKAETDPIRVFLDRLFPPPVSDEVKPNFMVVSIQNRREVEAISQLIEQTEQKMEVADLPMVVIAKTADTLPDPRLMQKRFFANLTTPFLIEHFVDAVNHMLPASNPAQAA
ncbi:response regulator [Algisphaera agarilytica]|uniref:HD-like signal output (HDOD) protein/DNA-binding NarL/FixJ family response regulator n=1 Tax=Algisphaera agarilytica TaxID=1385975 RepID=A0A7X0H5H1_9BACT|nr:response regulator [Algisphaera agarilytica]MBB6429604.1 HD-like signal output (HDOD) protein/DNA-binding NarL/FixJ family response regulator [Algisphaera agarilytica]